MLCSAKLEKMDTKTFAFRKALFLISNQISTSEVTTLKFYLADSIPRGQLEKARSGFDIFCLMIEKNMITLDNLSFLEEILDLIYKKHFIERYMREARGVSGGQTPSVNMGGAQPLGSSGRLKKFLLEIGAELSQANVHDLALFFRDDELSIQDVERIHSSAELFGKLLDRNILNQSNLHILIEVLSIIGRKDLSSRVERHQREGGTQPPTSIAGGNPLPNPNVENPGGLKSPIAACSEPHTIGPVVGGVRPNQVRSRDSHGSLETGVPPSYAISNSSSRMDDLSLASLEEKDSIRKETVLELSRTVTEKVKHIELLEAQLTELKQEKRSSNLELQKIVETKIEEMESLRVEAEQLRKKLKEVPLYPMKSKPHGRAIIIVNGNFNSTQPVLNDRQGADQDKILLVQTFKHLDYVTEVYENLTKAKMLEVMTNVSTANHSEYDSFVCCVSTHGTQEGLYGSDGELVSREEFQGTIKNCSTLKHKPKLFFLQACRKPFVNADGPNNSGNLPMPSQRHHDVDILIANASTVGQPAFISPREGSWFVKALFRKLTDSSLPYERTLQQMLEEVTNLVSSSVGQQLTEQGIKEVNQCVEVSTTLTKGVKFFDN